MSEKSLLSSLYRQSVAKSKDISMRDEAKMDVAYSTGFLNFDFMNGAIVNVNVNGVPYKYYSTGIIDGSMTMFIGRSGCGKTSFAVQVAANIVRKFKTACIFHDDIEGGITYQRRKILTGFTDEELQDKYIIRNSGITAENFYARIKAISDLKTEHYEEYVYDTGLLDPKGNKIFKLEPTVYILDSLALLMPEKYTDEEQLSGQMSATAAAKTNSTSFKRILPLLKKSNILLFVINHITTKIEINPMMHTKGQLAYLKQGEELPGGRTVTYLANLLIRFDDNSKLKDSETFGVNGFMVDAGLVKSRNSRAGQMAATIVFNQNTGFDPDLSLFVMLKNKNRINGAGQYLYIDNHDDVKFSQKNFKEKLATSPELAEYFMNAVSEELTSMPMDIIDGNADNTPSYDRSNAIMDKIVASLKQG